jgi:hypothetical protein|tara:strand:- start:2573 stop:3625 length:1053 start_codon:yes stop_codon:yes gene_type:complete
MKHRPRLTSEEFEIIKAWREKGVLPQLFEECKAAGIDIKDVKHFWHKSKKFSIFAKKQPFSVDDLFLPILEELQSYSPTFTEIKRVEIEEPHLLVIDPADVHVGKLCTLEEGGQKYDIEKACESVDQGVRGILSKASGFNIDQIMFVIGNDVLHIDNTKRQTTSGTPQDTDGMWHEAFQAAKTMYVKAIELMLPIADIRVVYNPSNHDYMSGYMLAQTVEAYFRNHPNVTFDVSISHRKVFTYGLNMIGTNHGDGAKLADLPLLIATEFPEEWANCPHRYIYLHHFHHKQVHKWMSGKDYIGVTAEYLRTPAPSDSWHFKKGYVGAKKAIEGFIHSKSDGQVARITHMIY